MDRRTALTTALTAALAGAPGLAETEQKLSVAVKFLDAVIAPDVIVHCCLTACHDAKRPHDRVAGQLADLGIAGDHGGGVFGAEHGAPGQDDVQGFHHPFVHRDRVIDQGQTISK